MTRLFLAAALVLVAAIAPHAQSRPNIVVIIMDDMGYGDLGSYGVPDAKTPNIDRLAREGVRMTDFYANAANCSPTRTAFISGRYQQRYGIEMPLGERADDAQRGLEPSPTSLPRLLRDAGYRTALVGKWHLGWDPKFSPNRHGFEEFWGFLGGWVDFYTHRAATARHELFHNGEPATATGYLTDEITARAKAFIDRHQREPFFVEVAYNATHWPFQPPGDSRPRQDLLHDGTRQEYVAMLEHADRGVGEILATLDRAGLARNTLVIFTSDNGGEWLSRNAPFFHRKSTLWEGGIRVPALLRWPERLPARTVSRQAAITMDLTATILAAAGATLPADYRPEGMDLLPLLRERRTVERTLFWRIANQARTQRAVRQGRWKYMRDGVGVVDSVHEFLFDLESDPGERNDLAASRREMLPKFRQLVAEWEKDVDSR